jgi:hypothetical protein
MENGFDSVMHQWKGQRKGLTARIAIKPQQPGENTYRGVEFEFTALPMARRGEMKGGEMKGTRPFIVSIRAAIYCQVLLYTAAAEFKKSG